MEAGLQLTFKTIHDANQMVELADVQDVAGQFIEG